MILPVRKKFIHLFIHYILEVYCYPKLLWMILEGQGQMQECWVMVSTLQVLLGKMV